MWKKFLRFENNVTVQRQRHNHREEIFELFKHLEGCRLKPCQLEYLGSSRIKKHYLVNYSGFQRSDDFT
jgi:hypothetical protein